MLPPRPVQFPDTLATGIVCFDRLDALDGVAAPEG